MKNTIRRRFLERDYIKTIELNSREYITPNDEREIDNMLDSVGDVYDDLTFIFTETSTGWMTRIIDNNTEREIPLSQIKGFALDWYVKQIKQLTIDKYKLAVTA